MRPRLEVSLKKKLWALRLSPAEIALLKAAAAKRGEKLAKWSRRLLISAALTEIGK